MGEKLNGLNLVTSGALFALIVALILGALTIYGFISIFVARLLLLAACLVCALLIWTQAPWNNGTKSCLVALSLGLFFGLGFVIEKYKATQPQGDVKPSLRIDSTVILGRPEPGDNYGVAINLTNTTGKTLRIRALHRNYLVSLPSSGPQRGDLEDKLWNSLEAAHDEAQTFQDIPAAQEGRINIKRFMGPLSQSEAQGLKSGQLGIYVMQIVEDGEARTRLLTVCLLLRGDGTYSYCQRHNFA